MSAFGAGNLNSYMGGGHDSGSQSTYAGNGQTILLLFVAAAVCMFLIGAHIGNQTGYDNDDTTIVTDTGSDNNGDNASDNDNTTGTDDMSWLEMFNLDNDTDNYMNLDDESLFTSLSDMEAWISVKDTDLLLKMLQNKTYDWGG